MKINEKIYKLRTDLGISQKEFADRVGTSQSAINYWENGKRKPSVVQCKKIASVCGISVMELINCDFEE